MPKLVDLKGERFGRLTVIERAPKRLRSVTWLCECDCGNTCEKIGENLKTGNTKSCGCLNIEKNVLYNRCFSFS